MLKITYISESTIRKNRKQFNTNNYPRNYHGDIITSKEYEEEIKKTYYTNWIHLIPHDDHIIIPLSSSDINLLYKACEIGVIAHRMSKLYEEELLEIANKLPSFNEPKFLRIDSCSTKDCPYDGPVFNGLDIIKRLSTSWRCMNSFKYDSEINIILKPWRNFDIGNEFRVFIYNYKITAISQYDWLNDHGWKNRESEIPDLVNKIIYFYNQ